MLGRRVDEALPLVFRKRPHPIVHGEDVAQEHGAARRPLAFYQALLAFLELRGPGRIYPNVVSADVLAQFFIDIRRNVGDYIFFKRAVFEILHNFALLGRVFHRPRRKAKRAFGQRPVFYHL